ncbi:leukocyte surface antigen CD53-like isoform X1 [Pomacea canaliculata]|uniref:leukocyte surface antigen CD53-like isoform X1 n=1 Tax=Pomacea canaliculata TaxID=400727 RepID=UPI000D737BC8|nr:leukocyte surface antigen CD53-like isoform X1 [Pomacea canaliculata]
MVIHVSVQHLRDCILLEAHTGLSPRNDRTHRDVCDRGLTLPSTTTQSLKGKMCISAAARVVLVVINIAIAIISLGVVVIGALLKFSADKFLQLVFGAASFSVQSSDKSDFNIPNIAQVSQLPFLGEVGYALIIFGAILFFVSFTACCGACCNYRVLLYIFIVVLTILVIAQAVVFALIMTKDSVFNKKIEDTIGDKVKSDFQANGQDVFSFSINLLNYLLDCCGIRGQIDFSSLPPTCCLKSIIDGSDNARKNACVRSSAPPADYNTVGCYETLLSKITDKVIAASVIMGFILLLQVVEIMLAIVIIKINKVSPL